MNKYIIWTSVITGEYVYANKVIEQDGKIYFLKVKEPFQKIVKEYKKSEIVEYHEVTDHRS